jgi:hypothetical protein
MLISNYGELKAKLSTYEFHQRFAADYDLLTQLFEVDANARLRVLPMEQIATLTTVSGAAALPTDYIAWRTVLKPANPEYGEIDYVHPAYLLWAGLTRLPPVFTIEGNSFKTRPIDDVAGAWEFHYYGKIPALAGGDPLDTNWLLTEWPNVYLFGLMTEAAGLTRNLELAQLYKARRDEVFAEIIRRYALTSGATSATVRTAEYF